MAQKKRKTRKKIKLSPEEAKQRKLKRDQRREIRLIFKNLGFSRIPNIDGKNITYDGRTSEMDDIFISENIILIVEYTTQKDVDAHLKNKYLFYQKINNDKRAFIEFLKSEPKLSSFKDFYNKNIEDVYTLNQMKLEILYCSIHDISEEVKNSIQGIIYFDHYLVQYFKSLTKAIKRSSKYEFFDFLSIPIEQYGENIIESGESSSSTFLGHILPEEQSHFEDGLKIVSFYIDADSLMKRSYVLRQEGWRDKGNIGHYQRMLEARKLTSMRKYLTENKRVYINNIIATIKKDKITLYDDQNDLLEMDKEGHFISTDKTRVSPTKIEIKNERNIIGLIDGQHRTYSYYEGDDQYESRIQRMRKVQNLLVTGIIFPANYSNEKRLKFEATLFDEINSNQTNVKSHLKQEIELMINPFSSISIGKKILEALNVDGPFENRIERYSFDKGKLKTASIVSFGLRPLIKLDATSIDTLYSIWDNPNKSDLLKTNNENFNLLEDYVKFCSNHINILFSAYRKNLKNRWCFYNKRDSPNAVLNVTFFNGVLNVLRLLIQNDKADANFDIYSAKLNKIEDFNFKNYKSSQYRRMGIDMYEEYFQQQ